MTKSDRRAAKLAATLAAVLPVESINADSNNSAAACPPSAPDAPLIPAVDAAPPAPDAPLIPVDAAPPARPLSFACLRGSAVGRVTFDGHPLNLTPTRGNPRHSALVSFDHAPCFADGHPVEMNAATRRALLAFAVDLASNYATTYRDAINATAADFYGTSHATTNANLDTTTATCAAFGAARIVALVSGSYHRAYAGSIFGRATRPDGGGIALAASVAERAAKILAALNA